MTAAELAATLGARRNGDYWLVRCPAHEDRKASLSIRQGNRAVLLKCFAGCSSEEVIAVLRKQGLW